MIEYIKIKREFLEELLDDEIELWNRANNRQYHRLMLLYQKNIDQLKKLLGDNERLSTTVSVRNHQAEGF